MTVNVRQNSCLSLKPSQEENESTHLHSTVSLIGEILSQNITKTFIPGESSCSGWLPGQGWSNKPCEQRKHTTSSWSCCGCFFLSLSAYPLGQCLIQRAKKGDIRVSIGHCPPRVMYTKACGTALLLVSKQRKHFAIVSLFIFHVVLNYPCKWIICIRFPLKFFLDIKKYLGYIKFSKQLSKYTQC